ncbi:MAG TPA: hypothetical protein VMR95_00740 [Candidatus Binatia bacterium]|nr:hypothetical protein [Candidatus Binatia bacterium]
MNTHIIIEFISLFFAGMLAGIETVIHYGIRKPTELLDEKPQIELRQAMILRLRWLVPAFFVPTALTAIVVTVLEHSKQGAVFLYAGLLAIVVWILVRVLGTVRINSATIEWSATTPPKDWKQQIASSERFHIVGTWAAILAFIFFLIATAMRLHGNG